MNRYGSNSYIGHNNPILSRVNQLPNSFPYVFNIQNPSDVTLKVEFGYPFKNINTASQPNQPPNSILDFLSLNPPLFPFSIQPLDVIVVEETNTIWLTDITPDFKITILNLSDFSLVNTIDIGVTNPNYLTYNPTNNKVYVSGNTNVVTTIDINTYAQSIFTLAGIPNTIVYNPVNTYVYISIPSLNQVSVFDSNDNSITNIGGFNQPTQMAYNSNQNTIYVDNFATPSLDKIDCVTDTRIALGIATSAGAFDMCYVSQEDEIYVCAENANLVDVIDCSTDTLSTSIAISDPFACAYDSDQNQVYIGQSSFFPNYISIDASTSTITSTNPLNNTTSNGITSIAYDSVNKQIFITELGANSRVYRVTTTGTPTITSLDDSTYLEFLYEIMNKPVLIDVMFVGSPNSAQAREPITISKFDGNGCAFEKKLQPVRDPYCRLSNLPVPQFFQLDSQSGFTFDLLPNAEVELFIYAVEQMDRTDKLHVPKNDWDGLTSD
jgi:DNA-binding beta-propeller fold protein YncE